jgi:hypothetical protein
MIYPRKNFTSTAAWLRSCFWNSLPNFLFRPPWLALFQRRGCWQDVCADLFCYDEPEFMAHKDFPIRIVRTWFEAFNSAQFEGEAFRASGFRGSRFKPSWRDR